MLSLSSASLTGIYVNSDHYICSCFAGGLGTPPLARRPTAAPSSPVVGLVIGQQVHGVSPAMQRAQDEAEIRTLTAQVNELQALRSEASPTQGPQTVRSRAQALRTWHGGVRLFGVRAPSQRPCVR